MAEPKEPLTERELEIVRLVSTGAGNKEIAARLVLSPNTVKVHLRNIFTKLEATSRTEVSMIAIRNGWVVVDKPQEASAAPQVVDGEVVSGAHSAPNHKQGEPDAGGWSEENPTVTQAGEIVTERVNNLPVVVPVAPNPEPLPQQSRWKKVMLAGATLLTLLLVALLVPANRSDTSAGFDPLRIVPSQARTGLLSKGEASRWYLRAPMPTSRARSSAVAVGNQIYLIGGEVNQTISGDVLRYELTSNTWTLLNTPKTTPVANAGAAAVGKLIYVTGGTDNTGNPTAVVEAYDTTNGTWRSMQALPLPLAGHAAVADGKTIYIFGGSSRTGITDNTFAYDTETNRWSQQAAMPVPRSLAAAEVLGDRIYVIGGYHDGRELSTCEYYIPSSQVWGTCAPLTVPRSSLGLARVGSSLFAIGGGVTGFIGFNERYDPASNRWTALETPITGDWQSIAVVSLPTEFYVFGGYSNGERLAFSYVYEVFTNRVYVPAFLSADPGNRKP